MDLDAWRLQYDTLYGHHLRAGRYNGALIGISTPGNWAGYKLKLQDTDAIEALLTKLDKQGKDIYFRVAPLLAGTYRFDERASAERNVSLPCFWNDGDTADGVHKPFRGEFKGFPHPTTGQMLEMVEEVLPASLTIGSGGGVHPYLILKEPAEQPIGASHATAALLTRLEYLWKTEAKKRGFGVDTGIASDTARILRVAGSRNFKRQGDPQPVRILSKSDVVYTVEQLDEILPQIPKVTVKKTVANTSRPSDGRTSNKWSAKVPVSFLMEEVWGMTTEDDADSDYRRWVYPREDGTSSGTDKHAKSFVSEKGVEYVVAYGGRIQDEWGVASYRQALTSWDLLLTILGGNLPMARFISEAFPKPSDDLAENLVAALESRNTAAAA